MTQRNADRNWTNINDLYNRKTLQEMGNYNLKLGLRSDRNGNFIMAELETAKRTK